MAKIVILGAGAFGISLAIMAEESGHSVTMWSAFESEVESIIREGEHKDKLPGVKIPQSISFTSDISCVKDADMVIIGVPSIFVRKVVKQASPYLSKDTIIVFAKYHAIVSTVSIKTDSVAHSRELIGLNYFYRFICS